MNPTRNIRLIAMDLDDTLLDSALSLSRRSVETLRKARKAGLILTFATNRSFPASKPFIDQLGISGLLIAYGGAQTRNAETGDTMHAVFIKKALVAEVIDFADHHGVHMHVHHHDDILYRQPCVWSDQYEAYVKYAGKVSPWLGQHPVDASKLMILAEPDTISALLPLATEQFSGRLWVTSSKPWFMEFNHPDATKGTALKALSVLLGIDRSEIAAFGDHPVVDRDMIEFAGLGVAMGNAPEALKQVADQVAPTNDADGVAVMIEEIMRRQGLDA